MRKMKKMTIQIKICNILVIVNCLGKMMTRFRHSIQERKDLRDHPRIKNSFFYLRKSWRKYQLVNRQQEQV
jgi:hypothetical protein